MAKILDPKLDPSAYVMQMTVVEYINLIQLVIFG